MPSLTDLVLGGSIIASPDIRSKPKKPYTIKVKSKRKLVLNALLKGKAYCEKELKRETLMRDEEAMLLRGRLAIDELISFLSTRKKFSDVSMKRFPLYARDLKRLESIRVKKLGDMLTKSKHQIRTCLFEPYRIFPNYLLVMLNDKKKKS